MSDLIGGLRLVDLERIDPTTAAHFGRIRTAAGHLARLLEDASVEFLGEPGISPTGNVDVRLSKLLRDLNARWSDQAQEKGLVFEMVTQEGLPDVILADRLNTERILSNLLGNALKFTQSGRITFTIQEFDPRGLCFHVTDTGPGFSEAALKQLYRFGGRPDENTQAGTGLGLFIAKQLSERLGATLDVVNNPGGGATATLSMHRNMREARPEQGSEQALPLPDLTGVRVLVAEDNQTSQLIVTRAMEQLGAKCTVVSTGDDAARRMMTEIFDVALIDIEMPGGTGIDAIEQYRRDELRNPDKHQKLPIIAVTAYVLRANREAIFRAGADEIISKPITSSDQIAIPVARALGIQISGINTEQRGFQASEGAQLHSLLEVVGSENAEELLSRLRNDLALVRNELRQAMRDNNMGKIAEQMHVLVAIAGSIGATDLQRLAEDLYENADRMDWMDAATRAPIVDKGLTRLMALVASEYHDRFGVT